MDVTFRPLERDDLTLLARWLGRPHVAEFWRDDPSPEAVARDYGPMVEGSDLTEGFVVELDGRPVGYAQRYLVDDYPSWSEALGAGHAAGIDYLIGEVELVGVGVGPAVVDAFSLLTLDRYPSAPAVVVAVQQANRRSWRALEKAGFVRVFAGELESDDPGDDGPSFVYARRRAGSTSANEPGGAPSQGPGAARSQRSGRSGHAGPHDPAG